MPWATRAGDIEIRSIGPGASGVIGSYSDRQLLSIDMLFDIGANQWDIMVDNAPLYSDSMDASDINVCLICAKVTYGESASHIGSANATSVRKCIENRAECVTRILICRIRSCGSPPALEAGGRSFESLWSRQYSITYGESGSRNRSRRSDLVYHPTVTGPIRVAKDRGPFKQNP